MWQDVLWAWTTSTEMSRRLAKGGLCHAFSGLSELDGGLEFGMRTHVFRGNAMVDACWMGANGGEQDDRVGLVDCISVPRGRRWRGKGVTVAKVERPVRFCKKSYQVQGEPRSAAHSSSLIQDSKCLVFSLPPVQPLFQALSQNGRSAPSPSVCLVSEREPYLVHSFFEVDAPRTVN